MSGRRHQRGQLGVLLLAGQIMNMGIDKIPPVTLATVALQVAIFLGIGDLDRWFGHSPRDVCISSYKVWERSQWKVLVLSALYHADDLHLYYNMASFLYKGRKLERRFKSFYFAYLLAIFTVLTSVMYVALNIAFSRLLHDRSYEMTCAVGFSGVIFALKVLVSHYSSENTNYVLGFIPVSSKIVFWAELVIIQLITPNASFTGHLAGILVGLLYIKGPLKILMKSLFPGGPSYTYRADNTGNRQPYNTRSAGYTTGQGGPRYGFEGFGDSGYSTYDRGNTGYRPPDNSTYYSSGGYPPNQNYHQYSGGMSEEEQMRQTTEESLRQNRGDNQNRLYPDLEELRQRRQDRYQ